MRNRKRFKLLALLTLAVALALTGCGGSKQGGEPGKDGQASEELKIPNDPVTVTFYVSAVNLTDSQFQEFFVAPLQKEHPNITLERLNGKLEDLIGGGTTPDIIYTDNDWYQPIKLLGIPMDLTDLTKKMKIDVGAFVPEAITAIRNLEEKGTLNAIPYRMNAGSMFYNKDIFDKFGIPYPKDDMTWDQVLDVSKKLTRQEDGKSYVGWDPGYPDAIESPFAQPFVDPKTHKALIDTPVYQKVFSMIEQAYEQPGWVGPKGKIAYGPNSFIGDQNLGMITEWFNKMSGPLVDAYNDGTFQNWDLVTIPNFSENAGKGRHALASLLLISQTSKNKEQAMQVIQTVTSKESQLILSKSAGIPALNDPEVIKQFAVDEPAFKGKNVASVFKFKPSPTPQPNLYDKTVQEAIRGLRKKIAVDNVDLNTALREAQEDTDKKLAELMAQ